MGGGGGDMTLKGSQHISIGKTRGREREGTVAFRKRVDQGDGRGKEHHG